jgi:hypothetical protein
MKLTVTDTLTGCDQHGGSNAHKPTRRAMNLTDTDGCDQHGGPIRALECAHKPTCMQTAIRLTNTAEGDDPSLPKLFLAPTPGAMAGLTPCNVTL